MDFYSMENGVKVLICSNKNEPMLSKKYGYIIRRLNAHYYEICLEESNEVIICYKKDFIEIAQENPLLYGMRDKIR